jgi:cyclopropane fatty-acyl-phospholipid synthase-like methyltransferase
VTNAAATTARRAYASESLGTRVHTALRWRTCPFHEVADEVPREGEILDVGCGHGLLSLYLAAQAPERRITGVDIDDAKLLVARRAANAANVDTRVQFRHVAADWKPDARWDTVVEVDMLYLLGRDRAAEWVSSAAQALEPGGRLVVKELDVTPLWKARWSRFQEVLATRVMRITEGQELELIPRDDVVDAMRAAGLIVRTRRLDHGRLHPHYVAVGTRPSSSRTAARSERPIS